MSDDILVATRAALVDYDGQTIILKPGTTVRAGHPIIEGREGLFEPIRVQYDLDVQTETADAPPVLTETADATPVQTAKPRAGSKSVETR